MLRAVQERDLQPADSHADRQNLNLDPIFIVLGFKIKESAPKDDMSLNWEEEGEHFLDFKENAEKKPGQ